MMPVWLTRPSVGRNPTRLLADAGDLFEFIVSVPVPAVAVATGLAASGNGYAFTVTAAGGTQPVTVDVNNGSGEATLVYQLDFNNGIATISSVDITTAAGLTTLTNGLAFGTKVNIAGIPQSDGTLKAYVITYFTNTTPAS